MPKIIATVIAFQKFVFTLSFANKLIFAVKIESREQVLCRFLEAVDVKTGDSEIVYCPCESWSELESFAICINSFFWLAAIG